MTPGTRIGPYEVVASIGSGGMGEVYRARDTKLKRDVALKVLPQHFTADPDRLARFQREAEVLAALNHPHIAHIYGVEESDGVRALVLELVDGPTLAERLAQGRLPISEALTIARQIADAVEAAHEQGIIHRDLKPANVKLRPDGTVKVLDFGLAKAIAGENSAPVLANSPTVSGAATRAGMLLGTAAYMSPEQARGLSLDTRTDIWSFGCVLFEMLAGKMAFTGATVTDILSAIISREPDWQALPAETPDSVRRLLRYCLEKDVRRRLRHIGDARLAVDDTSTIAPAPAHAAARKASPLILIAILVFSLISGFSLSRWLGAPSAPGAAITFTVDAPELMSIASGSPALSPDGHQLAFIAIDRAGRRSICVRTLDSANARRVEGTEDVLALTGGTFWSADGTSLGFFAEGRLRRIDSAGGPVQNITAVTTNLGATWNRDGIIVFAPHNRVPLHRVSASGGTPEPISELNADRRENSHRWPHFLPDGRHFLYTARSDVKENTGIYVGSLGSSERKWLLAAQSDAQYAAPGYLLFVRDGTLMAQRFDANRLELAGEPAALVGGIDHVAASAKAAFAIAANGMTLSYVRATRVPTRLTWFDRSGKKLGAFGPEVDAQQVRLSPDDRRAAVVVADSDSGNRDIWAIDTMTGTMSRLTSHPATDWRPAWSPDGTTIVFASDRNGPSSLFLKRADPSATEEVLLDASPKGGRFSDDWSRDGRFIIFHQDVQRDIVTTDLWALPVSDRKPFPLLETRFQEIHARVSPNGRWLAYVSNESGREEVYVKAFDKPDTRRVSPAGARQPVWNRDGRELYFVGLDNLVTTVAWDDAKGAAHGVSQSLFRICGDGPAPPPAGEVFDVASDGKRFLYACPSASAPAPTITVIANWRAMLERRIK